MTRTALQGYLFAGTTTLCYAASTIITRVVVRELSTPLVTALFTLLWGAFFLSLFLFPVIRREMKAKAKSRGAVAFCPLGDTGQLGGHRQLLCFEGSSCSDSGPGHGYPAPLRLALELSLFPCWEKITPGVVMGALFVMAGVVLVTLSRG